LVSEILIHQAFNKEIPNADPLNVSDAFLEMTSYIISNPVPMVKANIRLWQDDRRRR